MQKNNLLEVIKDPFLFKFDLLEMKKKPKQFEKIS